MLTPTLLKSLQSENNENQWLPEIENWPEMTNKLQNITNVVKGLKHAETITLSSHSDGAVCLTFVVTHQMIIHHKQLYEQH